jgi:hypothetical protein
MKHQCQTTFNIAYYKPFDYVAPAEVVNEPEVDVIVKTKPTNKEPKIKSILLSSIHEVSLEVAELLRVKPGCTAKAIYTHFQFNKRRAEYILWRMEVAGTVFSKPGLAPSVKGLRPVRMYYLKD